MERYANCQLTAGVVAWASVVRIHPLSTSHVLPKQIQNVINQFVDYRRPHKGEAASLSIPYA